MNRLVVIEMPPVRNRSPRNSADLRNLPPPASLEEALAERTQLINDRAQIKRDIEERKTTLLPRVYEQWLATAECARRRKKARLREVNSWIRIFESDAAQESGSSNV